MTVTDAGMSQASGKLRVLFPGLLSAVTVALAAKFISDHYGVPVMLMALLLGTVFTVIAVTALPTIAMIVYPMIGAALGLSSHAMGIFWGATIHDVAQVVGAGYSASEETGATAVFVKLLRVALLVPVVIVLSLCFTRHPGAGQGGRMPIPFFFLGFTVLVLIGSLNIIPPDIVALLLELSRWLLITAITALGMKTSLRKLVQVGPVPSHWPVC